MKTQRIVQKEFISVTNVLQDVYTCAICGKEHIIETEQKSDFNEFHQLSSFKFNKPFIAPNPIITIWHPMNDVNSYFLGEEYHICQECFEKHLKNLLVKHEK